MRFQNHFFYKLDCLNSSNTFLFLNDKQVIQPFFILFFMFFFIFKVYDILVLVINFFGDFDFNFEEVFEDS